MRAQQRDSELAKTRQLFVIRLPSRISACFFFCQIFETKTKLTSSLSVLYFFVCTVFSFVIHGFVIL